VLNQELLTVEKKRNFDKDKDTICALSTASGRGGIAVVRVSGDKSWELIKNLAPNFLQEPDSHRVYFTKLYNLEQLIDEVIVTFFAEGKSFTGEATVEISCHGSPIVTQKIINTLISYGARQAEPGEFTYRAYMNGKIDLIQAESILNLIESQSSQAANMSARQLGGELTHKVDLILNNLLKVGAHLEAQIDFVEQDIEPKELELLSHQLKRSSEEINDLISSYDRGLLLKEGLNVVLLGEPNVGKSSLLNKITQQNLAIVTEIPGTTRDIVSGKKSINGVEVLFHDTAGIRDSVDIIEKMGIERSLSFAKKGDLIFWVMDSTQLGIGQLELEELRDKKFIIIFNKMDKIANIQEFKNVSNDFLNLLKVEYKLLPEKVLYLSTLDSNSCNQIDLILSEILDTSFYENSPVLMSTRQFDLLSRAKFLVDESLQLLNQSESPELIVFELKEAIVLIHQLLGRVYDDQIMDTLFNEFCLGK